MARTVISGGPDVQIELEFSLVNLVPVPGLVSLYNHNLLDFFCTVDRLNSFLWQT